MVRLMVRFFKKLQPQTNVVLGNGSTVKFTTLDHLLGWFATDNEYVQNELIRLMGENRYAISEVSQEEFDREYVQKKTTSGPLEPLSREELSGSRRQVSNPVETLGTQAVRNAVAVNTEKPKVTVPITMVDASEATKATTPISTPTPANAFQPPTGKRIRRSAK